MGDNDITKVITDPPTLGSSKSRKTSLRLASDGRLVESDFWKVMNLSEPEDDSAGEDDTPEAIGAPPARLDAVGHQPFLTDSGDEGGGGSAFHQENGHSAIGSPLSGHPERKAGTVCQVRQEPSAPWPPSNKFFNGTGKAVIWKMKTAPRKEEKERDQPGVWRPSRKRNQRRRFIINYSNVARGNEDEEGSPQQIRRERTSSRTRQSSNREKKTKDQVSPENQERSTSYRPLGTRPVTDICDLVWAKLVNYPWWPALVCGDPENWKHHKLDDGRIKEVHVQFFGHPRTCDWIKNDPESLVPFTGPDPPKLFEKLIERNKKEVYKAAVKEALDALQIPKQERDQLIERGGEEEHEVQELTDNSRDEPGEDGSKDLLDFPSEDEDDEDWTPESPSPKQKKKEEEVKAKKKIITPSGDEDSSRKVLEGRKRACSPSNENLTQKKQKTAPSPTQNTVGVVRCSSACSIVSGQQFSSWQTNYGVLLCPKCWTFLDQEISDWKNNAGNSDKPKTCPKGSSLAARGLRCDMRKVPDANCEACRLCAILGAVTAMPFNLFAGLAARLPKNRIPSSVPLQTTQWKSDLETLLGKCDETSFGDLPHFIEFLTPADPNAAGEKALTSPGPSEAVVSEVVSGPSSSVAVISSNGPSATSPRNPQPAPRGRIGTKAPVKAEMTRFSGLAHPFVYVFKDDFLQKFLLRMDPVAFRRCLRTIGKALKERKKRLNLDRFSGPVVCPVCLHVFNVQPEGVTSVEFGGAHVCRTCQNFMEAETRAAIMDVEEAERGNDAPDFPQYYCVSNGACKFQEGEDKRCSSCWLLYGVNALKVVPHSFEAFRSLLFRLPSVSQPSSLPEGVRWKPREGRAEEHFAKLIEPIESPVKECGVCGVECEGEDWKVWCGLKVCAFCKMFFGLLEGTGRSNFELLETKGAGAFEDNLFVRYSCLGGSSARTDSRADCCLFKSPPDKRCFACWIRAGLEKAGTISFTLFRDLATYLPDTHCPRKQGSTRYALWKEVESESSHFSLRLFDLMPVFKDKEIFGRGVMEEKPEVAERLAKRDLAKQVMHVPIRIPLDDLISPKLKLCEVCSKPGSANTEAEKRLYCRLCHSCAAFFLLALVPGSNRFSCLKSESVQDCPMNPDSSGGRCSACWLKKILDSSRDMDFHVFLQLARCLPKARLPKFLDIVNFDMDRFLVECTPLATGRPEHRPSGQSPLASSAGQQSDGQVFLQQTGRSGQPVGVRTNGGVPTTTSTGQLVLQQRPSAPSSKAEQSRGNGEIRPKPPANPSRGGGKLKQLPALLPLTSFAGLSTGSRLVRLAPPQSQIPVKESVVRHAGRVLVTQSGIDCRDNDREKARELLQQPAGSEEEKQVASGFDDVIDFFMSPEFLSGSQ